MRRSGLALSLVLILACALVLVTASPAYAATLSASPSEGEPGDSITVSGSGFDGILGAVSLCWDAAGCADLGYGIVVLGGMVAGVSIPGGASAGGHTVYACQWRDGDPCGIVGSIGVSVVGVEEATTTTTVAATTTTTTAPTTTTTTPTATTTTSPRASSTTTPGSTPTTTSPRTSTTAPPTSTTTSGDHPEPTVASVTTTTTTTTPEGESASSTTTVPQTSSTEPDDATDVGSATTSTSALLVMADDAPDEGDTELAPAPPELQRLGPGAFLSGEPNVDAETAGAGWWQRWLEGDLVSGPTTIAFGPFVLLGVVTGAILSLGSGLVALVLLVLLAVVSRVWNRRTRTMPLDG